MQIVDPVWPSCWLVLWVYIKYKTASAVCMQIVDGVRAIVTQLLVSAVNVQQILESKFRVHADSGWSGSEYQVDHREGFDARSRVRLSLRARQRAQARYRRPQGQHHVRLRSMKA